MKEFILILVSFCSGGILTHLYWRTKIKRRVREINHSILISPFMKQTYSFKLSELKRLLK